jgi:hypothetical protein
MVLDIIENKEGWRMSRKIYFYNFSVGAMSAKYDQS